MEIFFTYFDHIESMSGDTVKSSFDDFAKGLMKRKIGPKGEAPVFCFATFGTDKTTKRIRRKAAAMQSVTGLTLDIEPKDGDPDGAPTHEELVDNYKACDLRRRPIIIYTTHRSGPSRRRNRIVLPFQYPVDVPKDPTERRIFLRAEQRLRLRLAKALKISAPAIDRSKLNGYCANYMPSSESEEVLPNHRIFVSQGDPDKGLFNADKFLKEEIEEARKEEAARKKRQDEAMRAAQKHKAGHASLGLHASGSNGLIGALLPHLPTLGDLLLGHGYAKEPDGRFLAPGSTSGIAGVVVLKADDGRERIYSHHSPGSDPLSAAANDGHALDALDVITILDFGGDGRSALASLAREHGIERSDRVEDVAEGDATPEVIGATVDAHSADWPEPERLSVIRGASDDPAPYPIDALPPSIRHAVMEVASYTQAPPAMCAVSALCAISAVLQGHVDVQRKPGLAGPVSLSALVIAVSGERKSTVDRFFARPISEWSKDQREKLAAEVAKADAAIEAHESVRRGISQKITAAAKNEEAEEVERLKAELEAHSQKAPKPVTIPDMQLDDCTTEAMLDALREYPSQYLRTAEGGSFFGGHSMNPDRSMYGLAMLNKAWDGDAIAARRKVGGSYRIETPRLTTSIMVQPHTFQEFLQQGGSLARDIGTLARFLICRPASTQGTRLYRENERPPSLETFNRKLRRILDTPLPREGGVLKPGVVPLNNEGREAWGKIHDEFETGLRPGARYHGFSDAASKAAEQVARIAAIFASFEAGLHTHPGIADVESAAAIVRWHIDETMRILSAIDADAGLSAAADLSRWLVEHCRAHGVDRINRRDIQRLGPARVRNKAELAKAIAELVEAGHIRDVREGRAKMVVVNPALLR